MVREYMFRISKNKEGKLEINWEKYQKCIGKNQRK